MNPENLLFWSLYFGIAAAALWCGVLGWRFWRMRKVGVKLEKTVNDYVHAYSVISDNLVTASAADTNEQAGVEPQAGAPSGGWMHASWVQALLPLEDRMILDQAGIRLEKGSAVYVLARVGLAFLLSILMLTLTQAQGVKILVTLFFGIGFGLMLPKWVVKSWARKRRKRVGEELPLFVDMLRLLQGVGLSIDQSLHILATEFSRVLSVISGELIVANRLYATGRSREHAFQRLMALSGDEDMATVVNLLVQVDKHGGAMQEPLTQFAYRLRAKRQAAFKEKIGTITVKMTGIMVLTLLPALIVVTAGPGFTAVMRSLSSMK